MAGSTRTVPRSMAGRLPLAARARPPSRCTGLQAVRALRQAAAVAVVVAAAARALRNNRFGPGNLPGARGRFSPRALFRILRSQGMRTRLVVFAALAMCSAVAAFAQTPGKSPQ